MFGDEKQDGVRDVFKVIDFDENTGYFRLGGQSTMFNKFVRVEDDKKDVFK